MEHQVGSVSAVTKVSSSWGFRSVLATRTRAVTALAADKTEVRSESFMIVVCTEDGISIVQV